MQKRRMRMVQILKRRREHEDRLIRRRTARSTDNEKDEIDDVRPGQPTTINIHSVLNSRYQFHKLQKLTKN